jgi:hypothetical protein
MEHKQKSIKHFKPKKLNLSINKKLILDLILFELFERSLN